jgi:hypothetical protein
MHFAFAIMAPPCRLKYVLLQMSVKVNLLWLKSVSARM